MTTSRRHFITCSAGAVAAGFAPCAHGAADGDWKAAFRRAGADPDADGFAVVAVIGDPHVAISPLETFRAAVAFWNGMGEALRCVVSCGDQMCRFSTCFGQRPDTASPAYLAACRAEADALKALIAPLRAPFRHVIGNHDTFPEEKPYPGALYGSFFPDWKRYDLTEVAGVQIMLLDSGHDGSFDEEQVAWMRETKAGLDPNRTLVLVAHQPTMGCGWENGIARTFRRVFGDWTGDFWYWAGHNHLNAESRVRLPGGGSLAVMAHTRMAEGFWLYGMAGGRIVARVFVKAEGYRYTAFGQRKDMVGFTGFSAPAVGRMPGDVALGKMIPEPYARTPGVIWKLFIGEGDERARYRVFTQRHCDAGRGLVYLGDTQYRLPLKEKAPTATRFAILGRLAPHRRTKQPNQVFASADGRAWIELPLPARRDDLYVFEIPAELRGSEWLQVKIHAFGYANESQIAGFALLA